MSSLVCCMIELQLPMGFVDEVFPGPLDVRRGVVGMKREAKLHLPLSCLFFLIQAFFRIGWAPLEILLRVENGFREAKSWSCAPTIDPHPCQYDSCALGYQQVRPTKLKRSKKIQNIIAHHFPIL